ncbi:MAG: hypothetical protein OK474_06320 [Thaumarchaeota archaeon]|nr:hypothetical protein [Nitrososphaerota archaeon]
MADIIDADLINNILDALGEIDQKIEDAEGKANGTKVKSKFRHLRATVKTAAIELEKDQGLVKLRSPMKGRRKT